MADVWEILITQLAYVRGRERGDVEAEIAAAGGNLEIDSKEGQTVAIRVEITLGMDGLIKPEDQTRTNLTTIRSLEQLIERRQREQGGD